MYCILNKKIYRKVILMIFFDRFQVSFIVFDYYYNYLVFIVVFFIIYYFDFQGEFKIRGKSLYYF